MKIIRDPIHEYITLSEDELRIVDSPWFQRLRHIRQNGPTRLVYPSSVGTRFEHSLGVMQIASETLDVALCPENYRDPKIIGDFLDRARKDLSRLLGIRCRRGSADARHKLKQILRLAALCHDLGHLPLSHTTERALEDVLYSAVLKVFYRTSKLHEVLSAEIVRHLSTLDDPLITPKLARAVILILLGPPETAKSDLGEEFRFAETVFHTLHQIIAGPFDADRSDYLLRDGYMSGAGFGRFDLERCTRSMRLCKVTEKVRISGGNITESQARFEILPTSQATSAIEAALIERYKLYKWVCFHHKVLFYDQVAYEYAQRLYSDCSFHQRFFLKEPCDVSSQEEYWKLVIGALSSPQKALPPLAVFAAENGDGKADFRAVDCEFFVSTGTRFFGDGWYCHRLRSEGKKSGDWHAHFQALVDRQRCGFTVWKDHSTFQEFSSRVLTSLGRSRELMDDLQWSKSWWERSKGEWLEDVWALVRESAYHAGRFAEQFQTHMRDRLSRAGFTDVRPLIRIASWRLFGNVDNMKLIDRDGEAVPLSNFSYLLSRLSGLRGEVPFFVYLFAETARLAEVDCTSKRGRRKLLSLSAESAGCAIRDLCRSTEARDSMPLLAAWNQRARLRGNKEE